MLILIAITAKISFPRFKSSGTHERRHDSKRHFTTYAQLRQFHSVLVDMTLKLKEIRLREDSESAKAISEKLLENRRKPRISFSPYGIQDILSHHDRSLSLSIKLIRFRWNI